MQSTYGIFDHEADPVIDLVRRHVPLAEFRKKARCPACGTAMDVTFADDGSVFQLACNGKPLHLCEQ
jgi:hypothetical protein